MSNPFDPTTGCAGTNCPPFKTQGDIDAYMNALKTSGMQTTSFINLTAPDTKNPSDIKADKYPAVLVVQVGTPQAQAVVYVNPNGASMFSNKQDSTGLFKLITGGVQISPAQPPDQAQVQTGAPTWAWVLIAFVLVFCLIGVGVWYFRR
jgi:hypothetical protein